MTKRATIWVAMLVLAAAAMAAPAADEKGAMGERHERMERFHADRHERLVEALDLSAQQIEEWREAHEAFSERRGAGFREGGDIHERIQALAAADEPDAKAIGELVIEAHRAREAARAEHEALQAELMEILTPEQRERFEALQAMRPRRGPRGRGPGHGHHRGPRSPESGDLD